MLYNNQENNTLDSKKPYVVDFIFKLQLYESETSKMLISNLLQALLTSKTKATHCKDPVEETQWAWLFFYFYLLINTLPHDKIIFYVTKIIKIVMRTNQSQAFLVF